MALGKKRIHRCHRLCLCKRGLDFVLLTEWEADELLPPLEVEGEFENFHRESIVKLFEENLSGKG